MNPILNRKQPSLSTKGSWKKKHWFCDPWQRLLSSMWNCLEQLEKLLSDRFHFTQHEQELHGKWITSPETLQEVISSSAPTFLMHHRKKTHFAMDVPRYLLRCGITLIWNYIGSCRVVKQSKINCGLVQPIYIAQLHIAVIEYIPKPTNPRNSNLWKHPWTPKTEKSRIPSSSHLMNFWCVSMLARRYTLPTFKP
jgi:hypothetical protein